jgi:hypothetical protein
VTDTAIAGPPVVAASPGRGYAASFWGLMVRDAQVLRRQFWMFFARTVIQPFLTAFVFAYVFPRIGQGFGGNAGEVAGFGTILLPGLIAFAIMFQGVSAVALPLVNEFNVSREIEDRAMAPLPTSLGAGRGPVRVARRARRDIAPRRQLVRAHPGPHARVSGVGLARLAVGHGVRAADGAAHLLADRDPGDVPRLHLLPVEGARGDSVAADPRAHQPARVRERGAARGAHAAGPPHVCLGDLRSAHDRGISGTRSFRRRLLS